MRVQRFSYKTAAAVRKHAPWAKKIVRVGSIFVAYERAEDAVEEHGAMCGPIKGERFPGTQGTSSKNYDPGKLIRDARRRGENA